MQIESGGRRLEFIMRQALCRRVETNIICAFKILESLIDTRSCTCSYFFESVLCKAAEPAACDSHVAAPTLERRTWAAMRLASAIMSSSFGSGISTAGGRSGSSDSAGSGSRSSPAETVRLLWVCS